MERVGLVERHPRLIAGAWFATFIGATSLLLSLVIALRVTRFSKSDVSFWAQSTLGFGILLGAAAVAGGWLGAALLKRDTPAAEAVRRGSWIGLLAGVAQVLLAALLKLAVSFEGLHWYTASGIAFSLFFRAGWLLPMGALAGTCLVRVTRGRAS